jgi:replicative DNA helicase
MLQPGGKMKYKIISKGYNSRKMIPVTEDVTKHIKNPNDAYYESIFTYDESHKKQFDETKSAAGLTGLTTNKLVFDFDSKKDLEQARKDAVEVTSRLIHKGLTKDQISVYFSGSKGVHVEVKTTEEFTKTQFDNTIDAIAGDLLTFDKKVRDENRIFRLPLTKHPETGKFKIPLTIDELSTMPMDAIQSMADKVDDNWDKWCDMEEKNHTEVVLPESIKQYKNLSKTEKKVLDNTPVSLDDKPNLANKPKHLSAARFALQEGFFEAGQRNEAYMILASTYRALGYNKELAYNMLKATNRLQTRRTNQESFSTDELWKNIIEVVYGTSWRGAVYSEKENDLLQKTIQKYNLESAEKKDLKVSSITDVSNRFTYFAENIDKNRILTGIGRIDEDVVLTTGMMVGWLGAPSSGKTSHVLNIVEHNALNGNHCFFGSFDMYDSLLYTRLLQKYVNMDMMQILEMMKKKNPSKELREAFKIVEENFKNVGFNFQSGPTVEDLGNAIEEYQQSRGEKVRLVVVDYLEKVLGPFSDATANSGYNAARLSDLAKDKDVCLITLLQPQKSAGTVSDPLLTYRKVKGASVIEQDSRVIITNWRPGFDPENNNENDNFASIAVVKNNMGPCGKYDFYWDGISGRIREMTIDEEERLKQVVQTAQAKKAQADGDPF